MEVEDTGLLNFTTWPLQKWVYYKVTSSAIRVHVKCNQIDAHPVISFSTRLGKGFQYAIAINGIESWIKIKFPNEVVRLDIDRQFTPILSHNAYSIFDICWNQGKFSVQSGNFNFIHDKEGPEASYVTFGSLTYMREPVHWKVQLTPYQVAKQIKQITVKGMPRHKWVQLSVIPESIKQLEMPEDAVLGGHEEDRLYVIRANHRGSLTPGKFSVREGIASIPWGGAQHKKSEFEVLCSIYCKWVKSSDHIVPVDALEAGYSEINAERLYIGRAYYMKHLIVGKVQPSHSCCYIPYDNKEISIQQFEVLVECKNPHEKYAAHSYTKKQ